MSSATTSPTWKCSDVKQSGSAVHTAGICGFMCELGADLGRAAMPPHAENVPTQPPDVLPRIRAEFAMSRSRD